MEIDPTVGNSIKIVAVGDALVGKSCAITNFETSVAPVERQSTIFDSSHASIVIEGRTVPLSIWDTTGKMQYKQIRKSVYRDADIILIFFSVINPDSFSSAISNWLPEVQEANTKAIKVFLGNKIDLRSKSNSQSVVQEGPARTKIQQQLRCKYFELSAVTGEGLRPAFQHCVREYLSQRHPEQAQQAQRRVERKKMQSKGCCLIM